jgi:membrane-bound metal-dependent hydrolase YbcI (DUF457 family)
MGQREQVFCRCLFCCHGKAKNILRGVVMSGKSHISFCLLLLSLSVDKPDPTYISSAVIGCLLADVDEKHSIAGCVLPIHLVFKLSKNKLLRHAGITHTLLVNVIILILPYILRQCMDDIPYYIFSVCHGIAFGYFTHLLADDFDGVPLKYLYYPWKGHVPLLVITPIAIIMYRLFFAIGDRCIDILQKQF